jgi:hypothetical protein
MIIESGDDVFQALCGSGGSPLPGGLWVVAMDENLRLRSADRVVKDFDGTVEHYLGDIAEALDDPWHPCRYVVLVWSASEDVDRDDPWLREVQERLLAHPDFPPLELLGLLVFHPAGISATLPQCEFSLYGELAHLPRAHMIHGPHGPACACPVCGAERRAEEEYERSLADDDSPLDYLEDYDIEGRVLEGRGIEGHVFEDRVLEGRGAVGASVPSTPDDLYFDPWSKRWYPEPARAYRRWTVDEETTLVRLHDEGLTAFDLSLLLQRQPGAIRARLYKLRRSVRPVIPSAPRAR